MTNTTAVTAVPEMPHALFDQYVQELSLHPECGLQQDLASEVKERLQQLAYILRRVVEVEQLAKSESLRMRVERQSIAREQGQTGPAYVLTGDSGSAAMDSLLRHEVQTTTELRTLTEAFYFFAHRVRKIAQNGSESLPFLKGFECDGVRNVRNHLIEHPERTRSPVLAQSFSRDNPQGPVVKVHRPPGQAGVSFDKGLYPNASEFATNLSKVLQAAISKARESAPKDR